MDLLLIRISDGAKDLKANCSEIAIRAPLISAGVPGMCAGHSTIIQPRMPRAA